MSTRLTIPDRSPPPAPPPVGVIVLGWLGFTIPISRLALFFDGMAALLGAGRSLSDVLDNAASYGFDPEIQYICRTIAPKVRNGATLTSCLRPYEHRFPAIVLPVLEVGELSGGLEDCAGRLACTFNQTIGAARKFKLGAYDPTLILAALGLIDVVRLIIFSSMAGFTSGPAILWVVQQLAETVATYTVLFIIVRLVIQQLYRCFSVRLAVDTIKLSLPQIGPIFRSLSIARWARSFATLWGAGVNISTALEVSSRSTLNAYYERAFQLAATQTRQGRTLTQSLAGTQLIPPHLLSIIATSEEAGRMEDSLKWLATQMEEEALTTATIEMNRVVAFAAILLIIAAFAA